MTRDELDAYLRRRCRNLTNAAITTGKLLRGTCPCGSADVEAHHRDYADPLNVLWRCKPCHARMPDGIGPLELPDRGRLATLLGMVWGRRTPRMIQAEAALAALAAALPAIAFDTLTAKSGDKLAQARVGAGASNTNRSLPAGPLSPNPLASDPSRERNRQLMHTDLPRLSPTEERMLNALSTLEPTTSATAVIKEFL